MPHQRRISRSCIYLSTFAATALVLFAMISFIPDNPYVRYQMLNGTIYDGLKWDYERIEFDATPIDVAILGNSRSGAAIDGPLLESLINQNGGTNHVANFSVPANGLDVQYSLAKRLLEKKSPRIILISLADQLPRDGHQAFADVAQPTDLFRAPLLINRSFVRDIVYLPMRQLRCWYWSAFPEAGGYSKEWNQDTYLGSNPDTRKTATGTARENEVEVDVAELEMDSIKRRSELARPRLPTSMHGVEFGVSEHYIDAIIKLASTKKAQVYFLYLPIYNGFDEPLDDAQLAKKTEILKASFLKSDPKNYVDCAHVSAVGSQLATEWLAKELTAKLASSKVN